MDSSFSQQTLGDASVEFTVTPGSIKNTVGGIALAAIIGFYFAFSNGANGVSWFQILFGIATLWRKRGHRAATSSRRMRSVGNRPGPATAASPDTLR